MKTLITTLLLLLCLQGGFSQCVSFYVETDYHTLNSFGGDKGKVREWVKGNFKQVETIYETVGIDLELTEISVVTLPLWSDTINSVFTLLNEFGKITQDNPDARVKMFWTTRPMFASLTNQQSLCSKSRTYQGYTELQSWGPHSIITQLDTAVIQYPTFSEDVFILVHEIGHVFGLSHTAGCNGDFMTTCTKSTYDVGFGEKEGELLERYANAFCLQDNFIPDNISLTGFQEGYKSAHQVTLTNVFSGNELLIGSGDVTITNSTLGPGFEISLKKCVTNW